ncbi:MAG: MoxR family ATPase [Gammaproteobacteria bacterium]|nr:MoxR family ATPase [Gammaproteobacteria bacterium]MCY4256287.1 MoxR family ATPase [Gammaproteobacteria bacterium]
MSAEAAPQPPRSQPLAALRRRMEEQVLGQEEFIEHMLIALLAGGHLLVEGVPGLAKTRAVKVLGRCLNASFHRVQFTPDLLPSDITGTDIFRPQTGGFEFRPGPLFHHLVLADEINRASAKVQSALLEAMEEKQVTVAEKSWPLPEPFLVMATQNPIEQEGAYPLPEAQLDRFLMKTTIGYPGAEDEQRIVALTRLEASGERRQPGKQAPGYAVEQVLSDRAKVLRIHLAERLERYIVELVRATRDPGARDGSLHGLVSYGASPRASIALDRCSRARAFLRGRDFVTPGDIQALSPAVLRHRIILTYEAEAEGRSSAEVIDRLLDCVAVP